MYNHFHRSSILNPRKKRDREKIDILTIREFQCLKLLAHGKRTKEIASILKLSRRTVETYINSSKLKLSDVSGCSLVDFYWSFYEQKTLTI